MPKFLLVAVLLAVPVPVSASADDWLDEEEKGRFGRMAFSGTLLSLNEPFPNDSTGYIGFTGEYVRGEGLLKTVYSADVALPFRDDLLDSVSFGVGKELDLQVLNIGVGVVGGLTRLYRYDETCTENPCDITKRGTAFFVAPHAKATVLLGWNHYGFFAQYRRGFVLTSHGKRYEAFLFGGSFKI